MAGNLLARQAVQPFQPDEALRTDLTVGLSAAVAAARLKEFGPNELETEPRVPAWRRFVAQFGDALVILLLVAALVSALVWFLERESYLPYEAIVIIAVVALNALMGFIQEGRAEEALAALRATAVPWATVIRNGRQQRIPTREVVPGDVLIICEGDSIPADAQLMEVVELQTTEASLTGESLPVLKVRLDTIFAGTSVVFGHAVAIVTQTGMNTELGAIAGLLRNTKSHATPLQQDLDRIGRQLGYVVIVIALIVVATLALLHDVRDLAGFIRILMFGVALAVAAAPESLAAVVTTVLALGVQKMARCGAIVRKLAAVESLGSVTVIASDKTGTLTKNEMTVRVILTAAGSVVPEEHPGQRDALRKHETECLLRAASLANNAAINGDGAVQGDPTEGALLIAAATAGLDHAALRVLHPRLAEAPFSSERKRMSTVHRVHASSEDCYVFTKGAAGALLELCTHELVGRDAAALTQERRAAILRANETLSSTALRTLGVACRRMPEAPEGTSVSAGELERDLVFLGLIGMLDPARPEAASAVAKARSAGIRPVVITGDHPATAAAIARETGISAEGRVLAGPELEAMSDAELDLAVREVSVFARVTPSHKLRIVAALQRGGEIVAMTGDGVNDAPALKAADIGIAMGITGTDVAKEASDLVLTDDNFATIVVAVEEGRAVFDNIRKTIFYLLSSNAGEVLTVFFAVVLARPPGLDPGHGFALPLLATQILWINLITDGAPALALGFDPPAPDLMRRAPRSRTEGVINRPMFAGILFVGLVMTVVTLAVFHHAMPRGVEYARTMAFNSLVFCQLFNAFNSRAGTHSALPGFAANWRLSGAVVLSLALHALVIYVPMFQVAFGTVNLGAGDWALTLAVASSVLWLAEAAKWVARRCYVPGLSVARRS